MLGNGELLEFDSPGVLLSNRRSHFSSLVEQSGAAEAEHLRMLANSNKPYEKRRQEMNISNEELSPEANETDSLVSSLA